VCVRRASALLADGVGGTVLVLVRSARPVKRAPTHSHRHRQTGALTSEHTYARSHQHTQGCTSKLFLPPLAPSRPWWARLGCRAVDVQHAEARPCLGHHGRDFTSLALSAQAEAASVVKRPCASTGQHSLAKSDDDSRACVAVVDGR
jgi:hypothetical protein